MVRDWIAKIVEDKRVAQEEQESAAQDEAERLKVFDVEVEKIRGELTRLFDDAIHEFNSILPESKRVSCEKPSHLVIHAHRGAFPMGDLQIRIDGRSENLICDYLFREKEGADHLRDSLTVQIDTTSGRDAHYEQLLEEVLGPFLRRL